MDILELLRQLRAGESDRTIAKRLGWNRRTVVRYRRWATEAEYLAGPLPSLVEVERRLAADLPATPAPQQTSTVAKYAEEIAAYRERGLEAAAIRGRLEERHREPVSYQAVWRFVRRQEAAAEPETFVRVEVEPGSEAQVDFGYAGLQIDPATGELRSAWVFVLVLSFSRHLYAEVVFDQRVETWLRCHEHAFAAFGGVPGKIVPDNLKAAIVRASFLEPVVQRSYRECAEHYGFRIDPTPPYSPHLKGKVESGVHYVKRNFLAGRAPAAGDELNRALREWTATIAGERVHGTTKRRPLAQFEAIERAALSPLPATAYEAVVWAQATPRRDTYLTFERAYYSAPYRLVGQALWVRAGRRTVELYTAGHEWVATHDRATEPGQRRTLLAHLPPAKVTGVTISRETCREQAAAIGPATAELVGRLLDHRPEDRLRVAGRVLALAERTTAERLERACVRAAAYGEDGYGALKRILEAGLDGAPLPAAVSGGSSGPPAGGGEALSASRAGGYTFVRQAGEFVASLFGASRAGAVR
jgi:transposase